MICTLFDSLKKLYISNKMEHFSHKDECGVHVSRHLKESYCETGKFDKKTNLWLMMLVSN